MKRTIYQTTAILLTILSPASQSGAAAEAKSLPKDYAVVVSRATAGDPKWKEVVTALVDKHRAEVITYEASVAESLERLQALFPKYVCVVATAKESTRQLVSDVHGLTRRLDEDPYGDAIWGILTGYDAAGALRIARHTQPLVIGRVASGTEIELACCRQGTWYCELVQGRMVSKQPGEEPRQLKAPPDTTKALVDALNVDKAQMFVTSGHATQRDWQIGYRYRNGQFRSQAGKLFGIDTRGTRFPVDSPNPKVYLPVGNCLMGHIDGPDAMALAFLNSAGVYQMIGYTFPTWYGYAGWGCLDFFLEQPGRFTFAEAVFANRQALLHRLETNFPEIARTEMKPGQTPRVPIEVSQTARQAGLSAQDARGLLFDRDVLAFYGDPAWVARMAPGPLAWKQSLKEKDGLYTFEIKPQRGKQSFEPINTNGSQRGGRPIVQLLPHRIKDVRLREGKELRPLITDNFILVPNPGKCDPKRRYRITFQAVRSVR